MCFTRMRVEKQSRGPASLRQPLSENESPDTNSGGHDMKMMITIYASCLSKVIPTWLPINDTTLISG